VRSITQIEVAKITRDEQQPRKRFDEAGLSALGQSILKLGQLLPIIVFACAATGMYVLVDGERRWRAFQLIGKSLIDAIVLPQRPTAAELRILQMSIDMHRVAHSPMEKSNGLAAARKELGCTVAELAGKLDLTQSYASKLLAFQKGDPLVQAALHKGDLDIEKAYIICQEPDHAKQRALLLQSGKLSRDQLRHRTTKQGAPPVTASQASFALPGGVSVRLQGKELTLDSAIDALQAAVKELRKGLKQHLDIDTIQRVMRDRAR
jgi:ParB family chromosome partitioning protein